MTEQLPQLIEALTHLASAMEKVDPGRYTLTGAADWPILLVMGGGMGTILVGIISFMWVDLKNTFKDHKADNKDEIDNLWNEARRLECVIEKTGTTLRQDMKECKEKCCDG